MTAQQYAHQRGSLLFQVPLRGQARVSIEPNAEVLDYVTREGQHGDLHGLYLILAADNSVHKFVCCQPGLGQHKRNGFRHNKLFLPGKGATASICGLMSTGKQQQVKPSKVWERLSE